MSELRSCVKVEVDVLGLAVYAGVKQHRTRTQHVSELRKCEKVEVDVLGSPSLMVYVGVKQH